MLRIFVIVALLCACTAEASFNKDTFTTPTGVAPIGNGWTMDTSSGNLVFKYNDVEKGSLTQAGVFTAATVTASTALNAAAVRDAAGTGAVALTNGAVVSASKGVLFTGGAAPTAPTTGIMIYGGTLANQCVEIQGASGAKSGLSATRLALGPAGSALPSYVGCYKGYPTWTDGAVEAIDVSGSGVGGTGDFYVKGTGSGFGFASSGDTSFTATQIGSDGFRSKALTAPAPLTYGLTLPGSAAPSAPTTGVVLYADLVGAGVNPTVYALKATSGYSNIQAGVVSGSTVFGSTVKGTNFYGGSSASGAGTAVPLSIGAYTPTGYGIGIGVAAPTFNGLRILKGTNPLVGYADTAAIYTDSASESLICTFDTGAVTAVTHP
jgi:hypothetical protein